MTDDIEPDEDTMSLYVTTAYQEITKHVVTTQKERHLIVGALQRMEAQLEADLY